MSYCHTCNRHWQAGEYSDCLSCCHRHIVEQDAEIERLRGELASANLSYLRISDDRDTLRTRLAAAETTCLKWIDSEKRNQADTWEQVIEEIEDILAKLRGES